MAYNYDRTAADQDNSFGLGYIPLPPSLSHLGRFVDNLAPTKLTSHKVFVKEQVHMLTCKVNTQLSCLATDLKHLLNLGLVDIKCNEVGTLSFYFEGHDASPTGSVNMDAYVKQAEQLGREAFQAGLKRIQNLDIAYARLNLEAMSKMPPAVAGVSAIGSARSRLSSKLAEAWLKGWDLANLAD